MFVDARSVAAGTVVESDLCIVGAGAAGIAMAREFLDAGLRITVVESGALEFAPDTQELYAGQSVGMPLIDLTASRLRYFGGTTNHWGGWCLPLDPIDFEVRDGLPYRGWPIDRTELDHWYAKAQEVLLLGPFDYRPANWGIQPSLVPAPFNGPHFDYGMWQVSREPRLALAYGPALQQASAVTVFLNANAEQLVADKSRRTVRELGVATLAGNHFVIRAKRFVLAAGGVETARLLLASGKPGEPGLGNEHDLVGRFFMVHFEYDGGTIVVANPHTDFSFYTNEHLKSPGRRYEPFKLNFVTFVAVTAESLRKLGLPNARIRWTYDYEPAMDTINALQRLLKGPRSGHLLHDVGAVLRDLDGAGEFTLRKAMSWPSLPVRSLNVRMSGEPLPNADSRITLSDERDALGMRRVVVDWRLSPENKRKALVLQHLLGTELGRTGFGRLRSALSNDDTTWPDDFYGDEHHMGTTRMHPDPAQGVVDQNCRVHGMANLYIASSSVFPTAGVANPTLTIVALTLRLADYIKRQAL